MFYGKSKGERVLDRQIGRVVSASYEEAAAELSVVADDAELRAKAAKVTNAKGLAGRVRTLFSAVTTRTP